MSPEAIKMAVQESQSADDVQFESLKAFKERIADGGARWHINLATATGMVNVTGRVGDTFDVVLDLAVHQTRSNAQVAA